VTAGSIGVSNSATTANNVYVISHGWMPYYRDWADGYLRRGVLPLSWDTWQGPIKADDPSTTWLYTKGETEDTKFARQFTINETGLAQEILKVDPNATVLAYSWIDESATPGYLTGYQSEGYTTMNGMRMAEAIMEALAPNYYKGLGKVHLIGHSHGARVATVAALALQQAAVKNPQDPQLDVVRQLTLLDSPEDDGGGHGDPLNPINQDDANFDWFYLAQLNLAHPLAVDGTVVSGQPDEVTVPNTTALFAGMGVTGPGVPAGTTIKSLGGGGLVVLSARLTGTSGAPISLGFWNWGNDAIFVDSYKSYFGQDYSNFVVNAPAQGIVNKSLSSVVDVNLDPLQVFDPTSVSLKHRYAANWYAGSATTQGTNDQDGLMWSPLVSGSTLAPGVSSQEWDTLKATSQFVLTPKIRPKTIAPSFAALDVTKQETQGNTVVTGEPGKVASVTLNDEGAKEAIFKGYFYKGFYQEGVSFNYSFTGGSTDGSQLQILLNGLPYFAMTGSVAESSILPQSGSFSATFGIGAENTGGGAQRFQIQLVKSTDSTGTPTTVQVSDFDVFKL
jgi:pimeloyl-ACP methyl ester carboxylesterase